jgi:hypothetical protein
MEIVYRLDPRYNAARQIANARFDYLHPAVIYFCESVANVQRAIQDAKDQGLHVRVRSGGHHHEGMCSGPNVLMIDVSRIDGCTVEGDLVRVGPGAKLGKVYSTLWKAGKLFPGGGCEDVRVGGLVQGGGWGPYGRSLGLTCDRLTWFRIVKADGNVLEVSDGPQDPHSDLFWAVCGGGGGNFGVITEFLFKPGPLSTPIFSFTAKWTDPKLVGPVIDDWRANFPDDTDLRLTSFARLSAVQGGSPDPPAIVAGFFVGTQEELELVPPRLLPNTYAAAKITYDRVDKVTEEGTCAFQHPDYQPGPPSDVVRALAAFGEAPPGDLSSTCAGVPFPHKISSCFPRVGFGTAAVNTIVDYLAQSSGAPTDRRYLSLHSLGGAFRRPNDRSCFAFRDKPFMLQYQAWWADANNYPLKEDCLTWIARFRDTMKPHTEGAFINFPDRDLVHVEYPDHPSRKELLRYYYAGNLEPLIGIKATYDLGDFFNFEMGIPPS